MLTLPHAAFLLLAPVAVLFIVAALRRGTRPLPRWRRAASLVVRTAVVLLLTFVMTGAVLTVPAERPFLTVFLADVSESVPEDAWTAASGDLRRAWDRELAGGNRCALVAFAGRAEVLIPPTDLPLALDPARLAHRSALRSLAAESERGDAAAAARIAELQAWTDRLQVRATDLATAVRFGRALFQEGFTNRLVLITDGRDTGEGPGLDLRPEDRKVMLDGRTRPDVAVVDVEAPLSVPSGEPFDVRVSLESTVETRVRLSLAIDGVTAAEANPPVAVRPGRNVAVLENVQQKAPLAPGLRQLFVIATPEHDAERRNNVGAAAVTVTGMPRVLLVEGTATEGEPLARMLRAQDIEFVRESPEAIGGRLDEFVAVILAGVPREALTPERVAALRQYVEGSGGGLWVLGSPALQGERGYAKAEIEALLPVAFTAAAAGSGPGPEAGKPPGGAEPDPEAPAEQVLAPIAAILFIVDKSGSMAGQSIALVKEACLASAKALSPRDQIAVLAFDVHPKWILEFTDADRYEYIEDRVLRLFADGGTHIQPALAEALNAFRTSERARRAAVKHAILLSDGDTKPADFETVTRQLAEEGVTVSTVCIGSAPSFDAFLMKQIATYGKGRFLFRSSFKEVPQVFVEETRQVLRTVPRPALDLPARPPPKAPAGAGETKDPPPLQVTVRDDHEILQGVERRGLPALRGKLGATARSAAGVSVPLSASDGQPVLALWRLGLGKTAVWTSDLSGRWSSEWLGWAGAGKLFAQLVRHLSGAPPDAELANRVRLKVTPRGAFLRVEPGEEHEAFSAVGGAARAPLELSRTAEGGFRFEVPLENPGRLVPVLLRRGDGKTLLLGAIRPYETEFAPRGERARAAGGAWTELERAASGARMSGDRRTELSPWLIVLALLLLPLDVALRRFSV